MILLYGGSFDPVHRGHVDTARAAAAAVQASKVVWIPAALSPLKAGSVASADQRREMLQRMLQEAGVELVVKRILKINKIQVIV